MSFAERLQAMELLWRSMATEPDKLGIAGLAQKNPRQAPRQS